ncbi:MAG: hypothetical protein L0216_01480 [Planctomycetales bacterium]|nr:hypothetical protein [Planctomycetales bacterium]
MADGGAGWLTRIRIFLVSVGIVGAAAGGGMFYLAIQAKELPQRVDVLNAKLGEQGSELRTHEDKLGQHDRKLEEHGKTLGEHGSRIGAAEGAIAATREEMGQADSDARARIEALEKRAAEAADARAGDARAVEGLKGELAVLREKLDASERDHSKAMEEILRRLEALERAGAGRRP